MSFVPRSLHQLTFGRILLFSAYQGQLSGVSTLSQYIAKQTAFDRTRDEDPREAILKYAEIAEKDPQFVAPAYRETQPEPIYDMEEETHEPAAKKRKFDPNLRQKFS